MALNKLVLVLLVIALMHNKETCTTEAVNIGVCYGMNGNDLPPPPDVIRLYQKYRIEKIRLYEPSHPALEALRSSNISVHLGIKDEDIPKLAQSQEAANSWFDENVAPYLNNVLFSYISVGNEVVPGQFSESIVPVMHNIQTILNNKDLAGTIKVTTTISMETLGTSYPPSSGAFKSEAEIYMRSILQFLSQHESPLMVNVYTYFAYKSDPEHIRLDYATFTGQGPVINDGQLAYQNMFDAIVDSFYSAMERLGAGDVKVAVAESGWPSSGNGNFTSPDISSTYNSNLISHVLNNGTPKRPQFPVETYIFAMFNENLKPAGEEQHFGLFLPSMQPAYPTGALSQVG